MCQIIAHDYRSCFPAFVFVIVFLTIDHESAKIRKRKKKFCIDFDQKPISQKRATIRNSPLIYWGYREFPILRAIPNKPELSTFGPIVRAQKIAQLRHKT